MADYYSILDKTISGLSQNKAETRKLVYGKARKAIDRQLRGRDPAPSEEAINRQMQLLEDAIDRVEIEHSDIDFDAVLDAIEDEPAAAVGDPEPVVETPAPPIETPAPPVETPAPPVETPVPPVEPSTVSSIDPTLPDPALPDPVMASAAHAPEQQEPRRRGVLIRILPYLLGMAVVAGGGYALWLNKDALLPAIQGVILDGKKMVSIDTPTQQPVEIKTEEEAEPVVSEPETSDNVTPQEPIKIEPLDGGADEEQKESVRLGENGESVVADPVTPEQVSEPDPQEDTP